VNHELIPGSSELGMSPRNRYVIEKNVCVWVPADRGQVLIEQESGTLVGSALNDQQRAGRWQCVNGFALFDI
jgi:hypothetical protein